MGRRLSYIRPSRSWYNSLTAAWITATLETDTTILNALNTFEQGLIDNALTGKIFALYPFVGASSTKHSYNFMDTSLYPLAFRGGWTHTGSGAAPSISNGYADTGLVPSVALSLNSTHLGVYLKTNTNTGVDIGCYTAAAITNIGARISGGYYGFINQTLVPTVTNTSSLGHYISSRSSSSLNTSYKNGVSILASTAASTSLPAYSIYLGARNASNTANTFAGRELAMAHVGSALTSGQVSTLYTLTQAFQTALGRDVL